MDRHRTIPSRRTVIRGLGSAGVALAVPKLFATARAEGRPIKIGMVTPETGAIAAFGEANPFVLAGVRKALQGGIRVAGERHQVVILDRDGQSSANRASEVASQLINNDQVDIMVASSTGDMTNPVSDQCELARVPCITSDDPWEDWFFGRHGNPAKGFKWTYHFFWGFGMLANMYADMWRSIPTNRIAGLMFTNDSDGIAANDPKTGMRPIIAKHGFKIVDLGLYPPLAQDFTTQIAALKKANCEVCCGIFNPPQFVTFWTQCAQQGYRPKVMTPPKALLFPSAVNALGNRGNNISTEVWWSHHSPFKSGLTGQTAQQFCDAYEAATHKEWTQPIGFKHANLEIAIDVLKRTKKLDADSILEAIKTTDYNSLVGHITWKGGPTNPVPNVCTTPLVGGQWRPGKKWKYDLDIVFNKTAPFIPLDGKFKAISYSS